MIAAYASGKAHFEDVNDVTVIAGRGAQGLEVGKRTVALCEEAAEAAG